jgi:hypothetical protein
VPVLGLAVNVESRPPELAREIERWLQKKKKKGSVLDNDTFRFFNRG